MRSLPTWRTYPLLAKNQYRIAFRQMQSQQGWFMRIVLAFMMAYSAFILLTLGFFFDRFSIELWPDATAVDVVNRSLLAGFVSLFFIRFLFQKTPRMKVVPYLHLPIKKNALVSFFQSASLLSIHNFYPLLFFVPFWMRYVVAEGSLVGNSMWIISIFLLLIASHFANLLLRSILKRRATLFYLWMTLFIATAFVDETAGIGLQKRASEYLFSNILSGEFSGLFLLVAFTLFMLASSTVSLHRAIGNSHDDSHAEPAKTRSFEVPSDWGLFGQLLRIELLLMWRNRRPRHYLFVSLLFSTMYLVFMLASGTAFDGIAFSALLGLFASGGFALNYGQLMFGWDSSYYPALVSRNVSYSELIRAKITVLQISCGVLFVGSLPLFIWLRPDLVPLHFSFMFYNAGVTTMLIMELASRNRQFIDIGKSGGFFNYEGFSAKHWLWFIPTALPPLLFLQVMNDSPRLGLVVLASIGFLSLLLTGGWTRYFARGLASRKHSMLEGYRTSAR